MSQELPCHRVIRKLGENESLYDFEVSKGTMLVTTAVHADLTEGRIDLALLNTACSIWVKRFQLLQSKIIREDANKISQSKYFVYMDEKDLLSFLNVELIDSNDENKFREVVESELITKLDKVNGPLWRLKVVKYLQRFTFVFTNHHAIADGKNLTILIGLFNIIGALITGSQCDEMNGECIESPKSVEEIAKGFNFLKLML
jgi:NRPS condensation-like uncharacterized protein